MGIFHGFLVSLAVDFSRMQRLVASLALTAFAATEVGGDLRLRVTGFTQPPGISEIPNLEAHAFSGSVSSTIWGGGYDFGDPKMWDEYLKSVFLMNT